MGDTPHRLALAFGLLLLCPAGANATPVSGPHETLDLTATTTRPNTSTGLDFSATYRNPANRGADPPALRRLVIRGPRGIRWDTSAAARCDASDQEIRQQGEGACPDGSRIGSGTVTARVLGAAVNRFDVTDFNADDGHIEVVKFVVGAGGVVRGHYHGRSDETTVPTCLMGGQPPKDCSSDQIVVLSNTLHRDAVSRGRGRHRRNLITTPPTCPRSGHWTTRVTFSYADGAVETLKTHQPCTGGDSRSGQPRRGHEHGDETEPESAGSTLGIGFLGAARAAQA